MKNKAHKGLLKRVRITKTGKVRHKTAGHKHLRSGKGGKRLRKLRQMPFMSDSDVTRLERLLFRRFRGRTMPRTALKKSPSPAERRAKQAERRAAAKAGVSPAGTTSTNPSAKAKA